MRIKRLGSAALAALVFLLSLTFMNQLNVSADTDEKAYFRGFSSRYIYDKLNNLQKEIYDCFDAALEDALFNDKDMENVYIDLSSFKFDDSEETMYKVNDIMIYVVHNNPQYFFWDLAIWPNYFDIDGQNCLGGYTIGIFPDFKKGEDRKKGREEVKQLFDAYINEVPSDALPEEKEKIIHDLMCERITYGDYLLPSGMYTGQNCYSALKGHTVCQGYADLFAALMNKVGVECVMLAGGGHGWDAINLHGYWYYVDVTGDDYLSNYAFYNVTSYPYQPNELFANMQPDISHGYDNLDDDPLGDYTSRNYTSRYIHKGDELYFILNDLDDQNGRLALYINGDSTDVEWVSYNGFSYKVINSNSSGSKGSFRDFVERLYVVALGRDSEKEGKDFWCNNVSNGSLTGADCAREFLNSKEFSDKNLSNEAFVKVLYRVFFNREAKDDPNGYDFWLKSLETVDRSEVVNGFINSEEWVDICASYGVRSGSGFKKSTASEDATAFATRLYTECLGRQPEEEGLKFWSLGLTNQELTGSQAAREFFYSEEFKGFGLDDKEYVTRLYKTFMGREPEKEGFEFWLKDLQEGKSRDEVFDYFCSCPEFTKICEDYGIER